MDEVGSALDDAFATLELDVFDDFELEASEADRGISRGAPPEEQRLALDVDVEAGESAAILVEQDGAFSWSFASPTETDRGGVRSIRAVRNEPQRLSFEVALARGAHQDRGLLSSISDLAGRVRVKVLKFTAGAAMGAAVKFLERNVRTGLIRIAGSDPKEWVPIGGFADLDLPEDRPARILLFVHGTFSSTVGSFRGLAATRAGKRLLDGLAGRYDAIVGFDHRTLGDTPEGNAGDLLALVESTNWSHPPLFDGVSYSRGGMVLRSLIEQQLPGSRSEAVFERAVFVGATNAGTQLAEPENWHDLVDLYTNLVTGASRALALVPGMPPLPVLLAEGFNALGGLVKFLASEAIERDAIPGLAAMEPDGAFVQRLNETQLNQPGPDDIDYHAIISNFEPGAPNASGVANELPPRFIRAVADRIVDRLMGVPNDLVVDTRSMTSIDAPGSQLVKRVLDFGENGSVYHTVYFTQDRLAGALHEWLGLGPVAARSRDGDVTEVLVQVPARMLVPDETAGIIAGPARRVADSVDAEEVSPRPKLQVEVMWGDVTRAPGDILAVGHYPGVLPQNAELALERLVSDVDNPFRVAIKRDEDPNEYEKLVITAMTRRNMITGRLGEITFLPTSGRGRAGRLVAVCGMGDAATFNSSTLRLLYRNLAWSLMKLPDNRELAVVLIGAGEGGLTRRAALRAIVSGMGDALVMTGGGDEAPLVRIVELYKHRAERILDDLLKLDTGELSVDLNLRPRLRRGRGRRAFPSHAAALIAEAASALQGSLTIEEIKAQIPSSEFRVARLDRQLEELWEGGGADVGTVIRRELEAYTNLQDVLALVRPSGEGDPDYGTRLSFLSDQGILRAALFTTDATMPERLVATDRGLITETARRMTNPPSGEVPDLGALLNRLIVPREFRQYLVRKPLVFEVDRHTALVHWEMLAAELDGETRQPVGLNGAVARQLRTTYATATRLSGRKTGGLQALVVGDPGRPPGHALPGARREAAAVARLLESVDKDGERVFDTVHVMIGAPGHEGQGARAAERIDVLALLMKGEIDVVHYAGHGTFDADDPRETGWVFADGLVTARELERVDRAPTLVFANACLSGRVSEAGIAGDLRPSPGDEGLLPSLADEFFNRGVRNYIGTAWRISDEGAIDFAKHFYTKFFGGEDMGTALWEARTLLHRRQERYGALWAAYQHYGDPGFRSTEL